jgi:2-(3-amino-3-carboxypropyl)histidine synthase
LTKYDIKNVALVSTAQHTHLLDSIRKNIQDTRAHISVPRGVPPYFENGQIIGCDYRVARRASSEGYLFVGGGMFHPLGLYLATMKPVVQLDPYSDKIIDVTPKGEKILKKRLYTIMRAFDAKHYAIIVGMKTGQHRPWLIELLKKKIINKGRRFTVFASSRLALEDLRGLPETVDTIVITSCPRLAIDDFHTFEKPVLTPGEAIMSLEEKLHPYRFPW